LLWIKSLRLFPQNPNANHQGCCSDEDESRAAEEPEEDDWADYADLDRINATADMARTMIWNENSKVGVRASVAAEEGRATEGYDAQKAKLFPVPKKVNYRQMEPEYFDPTRELMNNFNKNHVGGLNHKFDSIWSLSLGPNDRRRLILAQSTKNRNNFMVLDYYHANAHDFYEHQLNYLHAQWLKAKYRDHYDNLWRRGLLSDVMRGKEHDYNTPKKK
jgi:hypothetical protein